MEKHWVEFQGQWLIIFFCDDMSDGWYSYTQPSLWGQPVLGTILCNSTLSSSEGFRLEDKGLIWHFQCQGSYLVLYGQVPPLQMWPCSSSPNVEIIITTYRLYCGSGDDPKVGVLTPDNLGHIIKSFFGFMPSHFK